MRVSVLFVFFYMPVLHYFILYSTQYEVQSVSVYVLWTFGSPRRASVTHRCGCGWPGQVGRCVIQYHKACNTIHNTCNWYTPCMQTSVEEWWGGLTTAMEPEGGGMKDGGPRGGVMSPGLFYCLCCVERTSWKRNGRSRMLKTPENNNNSKIPWPQPWS